VEKGDENAIEWSKEMLSFYGVELQSHAAVVLGLALLAFAGVQAWGQLASASKLTSYDPVVFSVYRRLVGAGITYQIIRLYVYGKFASALIYATGSSFETARQNYSKGAPMSNGIRRCRSSRSVCTRTASSKKCQGDSKPQDSE
jgi:hypothetical protein